VNKEEEEGEEEPRRDNEYMQMNWR